MGIKTRERTIEDKLPGESKASAATAGIGHNNPPPEEQVRIDFREAMLEKTPTYEGRIKDLAAAADRAEVTDDESAGKVGDLVRQIRAMLGAIADSHKTAKQPFLDAGRAADAMKRELSAPLDDAKAAVDGKLTAYLRKKEQERIAREREAQRQEEARLAEIERKRREAEEAGKEPEPEPEPEPAPPPAAEEERGPIRSSVTGGAVSSQKVKCVDIEDWKKAASAVSDDPKVQEAVKAAALRRAKAGIAKIPGVRIYDDVQAVAR